MNTKMNKRNMDAIADIVNAGGAVAVSEWTSGRGRHTRRRATPELCKEFKRGEEMPRWAAKVMRERPRVLAVIAVVSMAEAKRAIGDEREVKPVLAAEPKKRVTCFEGVWRIRVGRHNRVRWEGGAWTKTSHFRDGIDEHLLSETAPVSEEV